MSSLEQPPILEQLPVGQAIPIVEDAYTHWSGIAQQAFSTAQQLAAQIANFPVQPVAFNASFDPQSALAPFPTIAKPTPPPGLAFNTPTLPAPPPTITIPTLPPISYLSDLLATLEGVIATLLGGQPLPAAVAAALRNRAYADAWAEEQKAVGQAYDEFASRGFEEPSGLLNRRVTEVRQAALLARQKMNRDIYIQDQLTAIENLRSAMASGVQLEGAKVEVYRAQVQMQVSTMELAATQARIELDGWRAQVELYDTQLKGELARLDAVMKEFEASVEAYKADAQIASAAGEYDNRRFQLNLAQEQAIVNTEMKRADQGFEQMKYITSVMLEVKKTLATVAASLASSAMSAVNIGASMSHHSQSAIDYGMRINYSGQLTEAPNT